MNGTIKLDVAVLQENSTLTNPGDKIEVVAYHDEGLPVAGQFLNLIDTFPLERLVAYGKDFVNQKYFRIGVDSD
jgi:hypothetical protein